MSYHMEGPPQGQPPQQQPFYPQQPPQQPQQQWGAPPGSAQQQQYPPQQQAAGYPPMQPGQPPMQPGQPPMQPGQPPMQPQYAQQQQPPQGPPGAFQPQQQWGAPPAQQQQQQQQQRAGYPPMQPGQQPQQPPMQQGQPMPPAPGMPPMPPQQQQQQQQQSPAQSQPVLDLPEAVPGLRWTFTTYPNTGRPKKTDASQWGPPTPEMVLPLACMYTPLHDPSGRAARRATNAADEDAAEDAADDKKRQPVPLVQLGSAAELPTCRNCGAHLNRHARCDFGAGDWTCPACLGRNQLPRFATPEHPALSRGTFEYELQNESRDRRPPLFVFVVDVCLPPEELDPLKGALLRALEWLPEDALVAIISFGHSVTLWEPGFTELNKCFAFRGNRSYTKQELLVSLGVQRQGAVASPNASAPLAGSGAAALEPGVGTGPVSGRFFVPLAENEFALSAILEDLQVDPFTPRPRERALRATGAALELATSLIELVGGAAASNGGKILLFTGGPCTRGPGAIVGVDKEEMIRSHRDLLDGNAPKYQAACEFYSALEARLSDARVSLDAYIMSLDQVGLLEMRACVDRTGGTMICGDFFSTPMFLDSFQRILARANLRGQDDAGDTSAPGCGFGAHLKVFTSADTKVCGAIGPCRARFGANAAATAQAQGEARYVSPIKVGVSDTTQWVMSAIDTVSTVTVVFDTESDSAAPGSIVEPAHGQRRFVQFVTRYTTACGRHRVRITSTSMPVARTAEASVYSHAGVFDQATAAAVTSRLAIDVMEKHDNRPLDLTRRWIDRVLVKFVRKFGTFRVNDPSSLRLASVFSLFPIFLFNLRRSEYFMLLNISPDETTFKRHFLLRQPVDDCLLMIQPVVLSYDMHSEEAQPVPLDSDSIKRENVLLMDAFFNVAVLRGSTVEEWRKAKYQEQPEYAAFKSLLERPERDAEKLLSTRVPCPRYTNCDQHGSQARHVLTRLNPSVSYTSGAADSRTYGAAHQGPVKEVIYTDDASISRFMQTLKQAAVAPEA